MRYALNLNKEKDRIEVSKSGEIAWCPTCNSKVRGRKGDVNVHHWAHINSRKCDNWYEPITEWHLWWQNHFPKENREVIVEKSGKKHRADILLHKGNDNIVIEVQNSSIPIAQITKREVFYKNLIWILNGENLASSSRLERREVNRLFTWQINFPTLLRNRSAYLKSEFIEDIVDLIKNRFHDNNYHDYKFQNNILEVYFYHRKEIDLQLDIPQLKYSIVGFFQMHNNYDSIDNDELHHKLQISYTETKVNLKTHYLTKSYWRKFIDEMNCNVFIDNLNGLDSDEIYWYTKDKIVDKNRFINKYLGYI